MKQHCTPLRYPGGKQKLSPFVREIITTNGLTGCAYIEPYAGGAGVAMDLLVSKDVSSVHLNDASYPVYCFWRFLRDNADGLCRRIFSASLSIEEWKRQRTILQSKIEVDCEDLGFAMFYLNRCNRSGILTGGVIGGLDQLGPWKIDARFPRNELIRRVELIASYSRQIHLSCMDAEAYMTSQLNCIKGTSLVYCDPPYFHKASGLYLNYYKPTDHIRVANIIQNKIIQPWIVSYDNASEVIGYYGERKTFSYSLQYNAGTVYKGKEVFFFSDDLLIPESSSVPAIKLALDKSLP